MSRRLALFIGNSNFSDNKFPYLRSPVHDAQALANALEKYGGFEVFGVLLNETSETIRSAIDRFYSTADRGDFTLLYFSGHGYRANDHLYLIAQNSKLELLNSSAISETTIRDCVQASKSRHRVIILDCCFSGAFSTNHKSSEENATFENLKGEAEAILASSGKYQYSFVEEGGFSIFSKYLIEGIETGLADENQDGNIDVEEWFYYAENKAKLTQSGQTPVIKIERRDSQLFIAQGVKSQASVIYINYANQHDDFIASWVSAKLSINGYKVQLIPKDMNGHDLDNVLGRDAAGYIFIGSSASFAQTSTLDQLATAWKFANRESFICLLKFSDLDFDRLPGYPAKTRTIDFTDNWAVGLKHLLAVLENRKALRTVQLGSDEILKLWFSNLSIQNHVDENGEDTYLSNWFPFIMPPKIFIHKFSTFDMYLARLSGIIVVMDKNYLITFACQNCCSPYGVIDSTVEIATEEFLSRKEFVLSENVSFKETNKKVIELLNEIFACYLRKKGLLEYKLSEDFIYYFSKQNLGKKKQFTVRLDKLGRKLAYLTGDHKGLSWHFAIRGDAFLHPVKAYFLSYHAVFKNSKGELLDKEEQHAQRRHLGRGWYNTALCTLMYGAITWLLGDANFIEIQVDCEQRLLIDPHPIMFNSQTSYGDPRPKKQKRNFRRRKKQE